MTYSLDWELPETESKSITMTDAKLTDTLNAGLFENAHENEWCWHGIEAKDAERVLRYIELRFKPKYISVSVEYFMGYNRCNLKEIAVIVYKQEGI